jgi:branched-chain amino acid transport system substrate-binding protein
VYSTPRSPLRAVCLACAAAFCYSGAASAAEPAKIGLVTTLSGPGAGLGVDIRDGFALGLKHLDNKFGTLPVEVVSGDDQQSPDVAKQLVDKFLKKDKVDFVTGIVFSNIMLAVGPTVFKSQTYYISTNAGPSEYAGAQCNPYFFNVAWQNDNLHEAVGQHMTQKGVRNVVLIAPNYPAGRDALNGFKRFYKGQVEGEIPTKLGQLDYGAELAQLRSFKPEAAYIFLPGGMGINFIKQFVDAGLSTNIRLYGPGFSADEDIIRAVGAPMLGMFNAAQWSSDLDNPQNKRFVADFEKAHGRLPSLYASQGYDAAMLIDSAVRAVKGNLSDKAALGKALEAAKFTSVRGAFKFNHNHYPIQDYYLRTISKDSKARITNRSLGPILTAHADAYAPMCKMR